MRLYEVECAVVSGLYNDTWSQIARDAKKENPERDEYASPLCSISVAAELAFKLFIDRRYPL